MTKPLRLLLFDATCESFLKPGLSTSWRAGSVLYRALGRIDHRFGARTWSEGLAWLAEVGGDRRIGEIQYWGHGLPGRVLLDRAPLDVSVLEPGHAHHAALERIRARLTGPDALWWFRTCSLFHGEAGHAFARRWTTTFGCRAAGHTRVIGPLQGGLHLLRPGEVPRWSVDEGAERSRVPEWARLTPRTITMLHGRVPDDW